jgi:uncharacterized protein involved in outer membrane biogenesis
MASLSSPSPKRRRWPYFVASILALLVVIVIVAPLVIAHVAKTKLEAFVQNRMHATLTIGGCSYSPPFRLTFHNATLTADDQPLLSIEQLKVNLIHGWDGLKDIRGADIDVVHPVLHLPTSKQDESNMSESFLEEENTSSAPATPASPAAATVQHPQLWHINLHDMEIAQGTQDWKNLDLQTQITTGNTLKFSCHVTSGPSQALDCNVNGSFDPVKKIVTVHEGEVSASLDMLAAADPGKHS